MRRLNLADFDQETTSALATPTLSDIDDMLSSSGAQRSKSKKCKNAEEDEWSQEVTEMVVMRTCWSLTIIADTGAKAT